MAAQRHHPGAILLLVMVAFTIVALTAGCDARGNEGASSMPEEVDPALHSAAEAVEPELRENFAETFAGVLIDDENDLLMVYRVPPDAVLEERALELANPVAVEFGDATYSLARMQVVVDQITADFSFWQDEGVPVNGAGPSVDGSGVIVYVDDANSPEINERLEERYAPMALIVEEQSIVPPIGPEGPTISIPSDSSNTRSETGE